MEKPTGEIKGWLCPDDLLLSGALRTFAAFFSAHPRVMAADADPLWIDGEGRFLRAKRGAGFNRFVLLHDHHYVPQPSMAYLPWTGVGFLLGLSLRAQALAALNCPGAGRLW